MLANISIVISLALFVYGVYIFTRHESRAHKKSDNAKKTEARTFGTKTKNK